MPEGQEQARIALIADALGNGFSLGELGRDIETRLESEGADKRRAVRDSFIAMAMGARLSGDASVNIMGVSKGGGQAANSGDLLALSAAATASSRAETMLRAAIILDSTDMLDNPSLAAVISALQEAGLPQFAGRVAAQDFLEAL